MRLYLKLLGCCWVDKGRMPATRSGHFAGQEVEVPDTCVRAVYLSRRLIEFGKVVVA